jgi:hypothetical protein
MGAQMGRARPPVIVRKDKVPKMKNPFSGVWRIVWMSGWDQDYVDLEVPGHITFETARSGTFQFGLVEAQMDCRRQGRALNSPGTVSMKATK